VHHYYNAEKNGNGSHKNQRTLAVENFQLRIKISKLVASCFEHVFESPTARSDMNLFTYLRSNVNLTLLLVTSRWPHISTKLLTGQRVQIVIANWQKVLILFDWIIFNRMSSMKVVSASECSTSESR